MRIFGKGGILLNKDRYEAFNNLVSSALKSMQKIKNKGMLPYGLASTHTICMRRLFESPNGITRAQLAKFCMIDKAQISRIVSELEEKGYVTEADANHNYRSKLILTENGIKTATEINEIVLRINTFVSGDIPEENIVMFYDTLQKICDNLKKAEELI